MALFPVVWGVTCHPHQDEHLVYGLLHGLRQIPQNFIADTIRARGPAKFGIPQAPLEEHRILDVIIKVPEAKAFPSSVRFDVKVIKCILLLPWVIAADVGLVGICPVMGRAVKCLKVFLCAARLPQRVQGKFPCYQPMLAEWTSEILSLSLFGRVRRNLQCATHVGHAPVAKKLFRLS